MRFFGWLLRLFAFLFNLTLSLGLFLLGVLVTAGGQHNIRLSPVPLEGSTLTYTLLIASIYGFVAMVLALRKSAWARIPMLLWNLVIFGLLAATPARGPFSFQGRDHLTTGLYLFAASLIALWGSWRQFRQTRATKPGRRP